AEGSVRAGALAGPGGGRTETGDNPPGWDQGACRCLQAQSGQLQTAAGGGGPAANRGRGTVCPERTKRAARGARWAGGARRDSAARGSPGAAGGGQSGAGSSCPGTCSSRASGVGGQDGAA